MGVSDEAWLTTAGVDRRLRQIIGEVAEETDSILLEVEVMPDHVHLLIDVDPQSGLHRVVKADCQRSNRSMHRNAAATRGRAPMGRTPFSINAAEANAESRR